MFSKYFQLRFIRKAVIKEISEEKIVLEYTDDKVYTFECKYSESFYAEGGLENFAVGDTVSATLEDTYLPCTKSLWF